jgi:hypothetical protein
MIPCQISETGKEKNASRSLISVTCAAFRVCGSTVSYSKIVRFATQALRDNINLRCHCGNFHPRYFNPEH